MLSRDEAPGKLFLAALCLACAVSVASGSDWPRFRGPNGTGISSEKNIPVEIGEDKNLLWKVAIPGLGNSSPIVADRRIYLQTASDDTRERMLLCLDLADGKPIWSRTAAGAAGPLHMKNTLASSSAAVADGRVFMPFWNGVEISLSAFGVDGKPLWDKPLGPYVGEHGAGHAPVVFGDKVFLSIDQNNAAEVLAFHVADGTIAWRKPRAPSKQACYSTPLLLERPGTTPDLVVASTANLLGYDPDTGAERWKWNNTMTLRTVGSPIVSQGMIFVTAGNGPGDRHALCVSLDAREREANGNKPAWETRKTFPYVPCMLAKGEHIYFVNDSGIAGCYVGRTGEKVWEQRLAVGNVSSSPLLIDGLIYIAGEEGGLAVFAAETTFKEVWSSQLDEGVMATPAVVDGRLLIRGRQHLYCFGKK